MVEKLTMQTKDLTEENVEKIAQLFPSCVTESESEDGSIKRLIDFEALKRQLSGDIIPEGKERYVFTWPGKSEAQRLANMPSSLSLSGPAARRASISIIPRTSTSKATTLTHSSFFARHIWERSR